MTHGYDMDSAALLEAVCRHIDEHADERRDLASLAEHFGVPASRLQRLFKDRLGVTPRQYAEARRTHVFQAGVKSGSSVTDAMYEAGYGSASRLYEKAEERLGMTPGAYKRGAAGLCIAWTVVQSPLGWLLVAATERGVCSVTLGDEPEALERTLRDEFHAADLSRDDTRLRQQVDVLLEYLAGEVPDEAVPLDVAGTAFQMRVWEELRRIPRGETISYAQLAQRIGRPTAARAVARACATNPVAVITPCHRVVRGNGELGGYRWGIERKRRLLDAESLAAER